MDAAGTTNVSTYGYLKGVTVLFVRKEKTKPDSVWFLNNVRVIMPQKCVSVMPSPPLMNAILG